MCDWDLGNDSAVLDSESEVLPGISQPIHFVFSFMYEQGRQKSVLSKQA